MIASQNETIESFLTSQGLVWDFNNEETGVYRVINGNEITNYYEENQIENGPEPPYVSEGFDVGFYFVSYIFNSTSRYGQGEMLYTNIKEVADEQEELNTEYWSFEQLNTIVGSGYVLKGVEDSLVDCKLGDVVLLYLPSHKAFGSKEMGNIPPDTPIQYTIVITEVDGMTINDFIAGVTAN